MQRFFLILILLFGVFLWQKQAILGLLPNNVSEITQQTKTIPETEKQQTTKEQTKTTDDTKDEKTKDSSEERGEQKEISIKTAVQAKNEKNIAESASIVKELLKKEPKNEEAHQYLIHLLLEQNQLDAAELALAEFQKTNATKEKTNNLLVLLRLHQKQYSDAIQIIRNTPEKPETLQFYEVFLSMMLNDHETSQIIIQEIGNTSENNNLLNTIYALQDAYSEFGTVTDGKDPHLFALLAKAMAQTNQFYLATALAEEALAEEFAYTDAWIVRGYSFLQMHRPNDALQDFLQAYKLDESRAENLFLAGTAYAELKQYKKASKFVELSLEAGFEPKNEALTLLANIYSHLGDQTKYKRISEQITE